MKHNRLSAFTLGVVITAVSVGAVTFANAAGDATLKACANKTTGAMRYISKGSCKKTETSLSWSQMGPQGLTGTAGPKGDAGSTGATGQNFSVEDADGKTLGRFLSLSVNESFVIMAENRLWAADPVVFGFWGVVSSVFYYSDATCKNPLLKIGESLSQQWVQIEHNTQQIPQGRLQRAFVRLDDTEWPKSSFTNIYGGGSGIGCEVVTYLSADSSFYKTKEIPMLTYAAPLTIVAG